jgi:2-methylcitrate dehydratase PrpD
MSGDTGLTRNIAEFAVETEPVRVGPEVRHAVRRAVLDSLGVTIAGTRHPASRIVLDTVTALHGADGADGGGSTIVGSARSADPMNATLANGVMAHVLDWDDTLLPMRLHQSATLLPALLAVGEREGWSGEEVVPAFAIGFEIQARLAAAVTPEMQERGWHGTGIVGGVGVAAALARLLGLDATAAAHAMGIAATGGAGLVATFGSMSKALNLGRAGAAGVQSAELAARGFTSHRDIVGEGGFLAMYHDAPRLDDLLAGLGKRWVVTENGYKPYPCGVVAHAAIDGVRELRSQLGGAMPAALRLTVPPETVRLMGNPRPATGLEAKFSVRYAAAVAWIEGEVLPDAFADERVADAHYREAMERVAVEVQDDLAQHESIVEVAPDGGERASVHVRHARGTRERPMSDHDLEEKFRAACRIGGNPHADRLVDSVRRLDALPLRELAELLPGDAPLDRAEHPARRR